MKYARGASALAMCDRCGLRAPYNMLVADGYSPGLRVHPSCRDEKHPAEQPLRMEEGIALKNPRPDRDDDSSGNSGEKLTDALFPGEHTFGGGT